jgi:hypothetical protein
MRRGLLRPDSEPGAATKVMQDFPLGGLTIEYTDSTSGYTFAQEPVRSDARP